MSSIVRAALLAGSSLALLVHSLAAPVVAQNKMYWTDSDANRIWSANRDGTAAAPLITLAAGSEPRGIAVDANHGHIYWTENGTNRIRRADLADGANVFDLPITGLLFPADIELDLISGKLYWADRDAHQIRRSNLDGTDNQLILDFPGASNNASPYFLALDVPAGQLYWSNFDAGAIRRAGLDGAGQTNVVIGLDRARDMAIDPAAARIYWADRDTRLIQRQNLDTTARQNLYGPTGLTLPHGVALDTNAGFIYWADSDGRTVFRGSLDGSTAMTPLVGAAAGLLNPWDIALDTVVIPEPATGVVAGAIAIVAAVGQIRRRRHPKSARNLAKTPLRSCGRL
jgi:DNA-binding beta-propeller fold protein YncE